MSLRSLTVLILLVLPLSAQQIRFKSVTPDKVAARLNPSPDSLAERAETLQALFNEAGCKGDKLTTEEVKDFPAPNIICTLPGSGSSVVVVGARYDKPQDQPFADNWSAASLLPSLFQGLVDDPRKATLVFVAFPDEKMERDGAETFVESLSKEERKQIRAMVSLDSLGLSATKIWVDTSDKDLVDALSKVAAAMKLPISGMNLGKSARFNSKPFSDEKIPSIDVHSLDQKSIDALAKSDGEMPPMDMAEYHRTYSLLLGYVAFLDLSSPTD